MTAIVEVNALTTAYENSIILDNISFTVETSEIFAISGPSGCGKTTLFNHMIGLLQPQSGMISINGEDLTDADESTRINILKKIGVMYQSGALFSSMTLLENVMLPLVAWTTLPKVALEKVALNKLALVNLADAADKLPADISGGMNKRAAIARAIALDPDVVFLDEPSAGLDPTAAFALDQLMIELCRTLGITFVVITHDVRSIMAIADNMIMLHDKKIIAQGKPSVLRQSEEPYVKDFFRKGLFDADT